MNWKAFLFNLAGAAVGGASVALTAAAKGVPLSGKGIAIAAGGAAIANVVGLFQQPPHQQE